ncbi:MAG: efflux RND transporter periplasmic adaptor subunit [Candidatus Brocadiaceae bacterium]|nr:efflux RND transporter periplasmic adaptor subunit [Candidatus Brocadiaceae bacterium]
MKTNVAIKVCLISLAVVAVTFLVLKLTLWKATPETYLKGLKKGAKNYHGSKGRDLQRTGKKAGKTDVAFTGSNKSDSKSVPVEAVRVKRDDIEIFLVNNCTLESEKQVDVAAKASGIVLKILVEEGDYVESGKPLAKLDDKEALLALREAKLKKENAERVYTSSLNNFKDNIISKEEFEDKKFQLEIASVELKKKQLEYEYITIESPIDGIIVERNIEEGYNIAKDEMVFKIADFDPILARIFISEKNINKIAEGQTAKIISEFLPEKEFIGKIKIVSPVVDPESGTIKATIEIRNQMDGILKPGMFVSVFAVVGLHNDALVIPKKALILEAEADEVFIAKDFIVINMKTDQAERLSVGNHVKCNQNVNVEESVTENSIINGKVVDITRNYEDASMNNITIETVDAINLDINKLFEKVSFFNNQDVLVLQIKGIGFKVETKAFKTKITLGLKEGNYVEVLTGLKESDRVITVGQDDISHGVNITIINE